MDVKIIVFMIVLGTIAAMSTVGVIFISAALRESRVMYSTLRQYAVENDEHIKHQRKSITNLEDLLNDALDGQLNLISNLEQFTEHMNDADRAIVKNWKISIARVKEVYVDKWRAASRGEVFTDALDFGASNKEDSKDG